MPDQSEIAVEDGIAEYPSGPYTAPFQIGNESGKPFAFWYGDNGWVVRSFGAWKDGNGIRGIRLIYTNESVWDAGVQQREYSQIDLAPAETISELTIWGKGESFVRRIRFKTSTGQLFDWGKSDTSGVPASPASDLGSGILVGAAGTTPDDEGVINSLSFIFLKKVRAVVLKVDKYINDPSEMPSSDQPQPLPSSFANMTYTNNSKEVATWRFQNSISRTKTRQWSESSSMQYGAQVTVSASFFDIAKVSAGFNWSHTETVENSTSTTDEIAFSWDLSAELQPKTTAQAKASCLIAEVDLGFDATVTVDFYSTDPPFTYNTSGRFKDVLYAGFDATIGSSTSIGESVTYHKIIPLKVK